MSREEIFDKVRDVLVEVLAVDEDEVTEQATLTSQLGAESIDFLDIVFRLEQAFEFKIGQGELFPDNVAQDPEYVQDGMVTDKGLATLRERLPHADFATLEADRKIANVGEIFTVDAVVNFVERKLAV
ncbi:MAG: acyl carrier protein [Planctomycetes bacterium]|nr:acyl carrier protein [Planctomycetota bacterium]MCH7960942.1 acyl carrier protein [Planctomycetota bacterium]